MRNDWLNAIGIKDVTSTGSERNSEIALRLQGFVKLLVKFHYAKERQKLIWILSASFMFFFSPKETKKKQAKANIIIKPCTFILRNLENIWKSNFGRAKILSQLLIRTKFLTKQIADSRFQKIMNVRGENGNDKSKLLFFLSGRIVIL